MGNGKCSPRRSNSTIYYIFMMTIVTIVARWLWMCNCSERAPLGLVVRERGVSWIFMNKFLNSSRLEETTAEQ